VGDVRTVERGRVVAVREEVVSRLQANQRARTRLNSFWVAGHAYLILTAVLYIVWAFSDRVGGLDWQKEWAYFSAIKTSLLSGHLIPIMWSPPAQVAWYPAIVHSSSFVGNPETMLFSPFTLLLILLPVSTYVKVLALAHLGLGIAGTLLLARRLAWTPVQTRTFSALFFLSPIIIQHVAVGYTPWLTLFFVPWLFYALADAQLVRGSVLMGAVLALMLLEGGVHVCLWSLLLVGLYTGCAAVGTRSVWPLTRLALSLCALGILAWVRLSSTIHAYSGFHQLAKPGYSPANFAMWGLVPQIPVHANGQLSLTIWMGVPFWDGAVFWGMALPLAAVLVLRYPALRHQAANSSVAWGAMLVSALVLLTLSFGALYPTLTSVVEHVVRVPFIDLETYPYRLAIPSYYAFSFVAAEHARLLWQHLARTPQRRLVCEGILTVPLWCVSFTWLAAALAVPTVAYAGIAQAITPATIRFAPTTEALPVILTVAAWMILVAVGAWIWVRRRSATGSANE